VPAVVAIVATDGVPLTMEKSNGGAPARRSSDIQMLVPAGELGVPTET
jgi:hypothetical protein